MVGSEITLKLTHSFPRSFINGGLEFIAHKKANEYFRLEDCECEFDVKCKVLEWLSRGAYKTEPFDSYNENEKFHEFMLEGINKYLGKKAVKLTRYGIYLITTLLGERALQILEHHPTTIAHHAEHYVDEILE